MLHTAGTCPHCHKDCGFNILFGDFYSSPKTDEDLVKSQHSGPVFGSVEAENYSILYCGALCAECGEPVLLFLEVENANLFYLRECIRNQEKVYQGNTPRIIRMAPAPRKPWSHPALSPEVAQAFMDLQRMVWQKLMPCFILTGCRMVLEKACDELGAVGKTLCERIKDLKDRGVITGVIYDWATEIRHWGNFGAHDFAGSQEEAEELTEFTQLFLQYAFELPARVKESRARRMS